MKLREIKGLVQSHMAGKLLRVARGLRSHSSAWCNWRETNCLPQASHFYRENVMSLGQHCFQVFLLKCTISLELSNTLYQIT